MKKKNGFTLIELLVVISIIMLISSIIIASLSSVKRKATDAAIMKEVQNFAQLMHLEYAQTNSYAALQAAWDSSTTDCSNSFSGTNAEKAREMCSSIVNKISGASSKLHTGVSVTAGRSNATHFAIMAWIPGESKYYCVGSSGNTSLTNNGSWGLPGCYANP